MSMHSLAATVISTAVVSAGATTVVNQMVTRRWRRTRDRLGRLFGNGDRRAGAIVEAELEAYAELVARAKGTENVALRQHLGTVIEARLTGFANTSAASAADLRVLLAELAGSGPGGGFGPTGESGAAESGFGDDANWHNDAMADLSEPELERLGGIAWRDGDFAVAKRDFELALAKAQAAKAPAAEARALNNLGTTHDRLGDPDQAGICFTRAVDLYRAVGDRHGEAEALTHLALTLRRQGRYGPATDELHKALLLHRDSGDRFGEANVLSVLGELKRAAGDLPGALATHRQALEIHCELSRADAEATSFNDCATTLLEMNHPEAALTAHANALTVAQRVGADTERARAHDGIATILYSQQDRIGARTHWSLAWHLFRDVDTDRAETVAARLRHLD